LRRVVVVGHAWGVRWALMFVVGLSLWAGTAQAQRRLCFYVGSGEGPSVLVDAPTRFTIVDALSWVQQLDVVPYAGVECPSGALPLQLSWHVGAPDPHGVRPITVTLSDGARGRLQLTTFLPHTEVAITARELLAGAIANVVAEQRLRIETTLPEGSRGWRRERAGDSLITPLSFRAAR
jgi:hypothetical protein